MPLLSNWSGRRLVKWCLGWFDAFGCSRERMTSIFNHGWMLALLFGCRCLSVCELIKRQKGIWWMPWCQEAMKDVTRCEKPGGAASRH